MAKLNVNIGLSVNDKTGDTLRSAFDKINQNFTELYTLTGGSALNLQELAQDYAAPMFNHASHVNITATYDDANNKIVLTGVAAAQIQSDWTQATTSALDYIKNKPALFSGSYTDLTNKPTIPTSFSSLVNGAKTVSLESDGSTTFPNDVKLKSGSNHSLSIGFQFDPGTQGTNAVAIGAGAGSGLQGDYATAVGTGAGQLSQGQSAVAVGYVAGGNYQNVGAVAIGQEAGTGGGASGGTYNPTGSTGTTLNLVAPGANNPVVPGMKVVGTGFTTQTVVSVNSATQVILSAPPNSTPSGTIQFIPAQGYYSIAIGFRAGGGNNTTTVPQANGTIVLNASNVALSGVPQQTNSFYVNPIRTDATPGNVLFYNTTTKEVTYGTAPAATVSSLVNGAKTVSLDSGGNLTFADAGSTFFGSGFLQSGTEGTNIGIKSWNSRQKVFVNETNVTVQTVNNSSQAYNWTFGTDGGLTLPSIGKISNGAYDWTFGSTGALTLSNASTISPVAQIGYSYGPYASDIYNNTTGGALNSGRLTSVDVGNLAHNNLFNPPTPTSTTTTGTIASNGDFTPGTPTTGTFTRFIAIIVNGAYIGSLAYRDDANPSAGLKIESFASYTGPVVTSGTLIQGYSGHITRTPKTTTYVRWANGSSSQVTGSRVNQYTDANSIAGLITTDDVSGKSFPATLYTANYVPGGTAIGVNSNNWKFGADGTTTFPTNISVNYSGGNVQFPRIIADSGKAFSVQGQGSTGSAALAWTVDPDAAGQYAQIGVTKNGGDNLAKVILTAQSDSSNAGTAKTWKFDETGKLTFPNGALKIAGNTISNLTGVGTSLVSGSQLEVSPTKTVITHGTTNYLDDPSFPSLISQYLSETSANGILNALQVTTMLDATSGLTSEHLTELDQTSFKIGLRVTNILEEGGVTAFNGWTFGTVDTLQAITFPQGTVIRETPTEHGLYRTKYSGTFVLDPTWFAANAGNIVNGDSFPEGILQNYDMVTGAFSFQYFGYFVPPTSANYTFRAHADETFVFWIGSKALSGYTYANKDMYGNYNGTFPEQQTQSFTIALTAGEFYPIRLQWANSGGIGQLDVFTWANDVGQANTANFTGRVFRENTGTAKIAVNDNRSIILSTDNATDNNWTFAPNGALTLPNSAVIGQASDIEITAASTAYTNGLAIWEGVRASYQAYANGLGITMWPFITWNATGTTAAGFLSQLSTAWQIQQGAPSSPPTPLIFQPAISTAIYIEIRDALAIVRDSYATWQALLTSVKITSGSESVTLMSNGKLIVPGIVQTDVEEDITIRTRYAVPASPSGTTTANKDFIFGTNGSLTAPGNLQVNGGKIILNTGGNAYVESVDYGVNSANSALNIFGGPYQKINLRAGFGTQATWTLATDGTLTVPGSIIGTATQNVFNTTSTTVNAFGAATTLNIGVAGGTTTIAGDLTVNGTTTTINSTTLTVDDKNIELGSVATPTNTTADGGGITLKGDTDKTIIWDNANSNWTSSEHWNIASGKSYKINNVAVLSASAVLASATGVTVGGTGTTTIALGTNTTATNTVTVGGAIDGNTLKVAGTTTGTINLTTDVTSGTVNIFTSATGTITIGTAGSGIVGFAKTATTSSTASSLGYLGLPQSATNTSATLAIGDAGKHIYVNTASQTMTIPANSSVAYPIGTTLTFIAGPSATTVSIAITTDTMYLAGTGTTGTRTLAAHGMATAVKVAATTWYINGTGLT